MHGSDSVFSPHLILSTADESEHEGTCVRYVNVQFGPGWPGSSADELGFDTTNRLIRIHDIRATILRLLGLEHTRLTYRFQGRDYRLTDVAGKVVRELLA